MLLSACFVSEKEDKLLIFRKKKILAVDVLNFIESVRVYIQRKVIFLPRFYGSQNQGTYQTVILGKHLRHPPCMTFHPPKKKQTPEGSHNNTVALEENKLDTHTLDLFGTRV